jgi:leucyl aminopeptidase
VAARNSRGYESVTLDIGNGIDGAGVAAAEGFLLGSYAFSRYLTEQPKASTRVTVTGATKADIKRAEIYCEATAWARDLVNEPPSGRNPEAVAEQAKDRASKAGLKVKILDEAALAKQGMNGILTVGKGSDAPPRLLLLTYEPRGAKGFLGLVGKGITFDSGGLSIKTGEGMETMKMDCSGGAAVIAAMTALPALGLKIKVVAAVALAENMPGGSAVKPGDVIRHYGGHTSEVLNTDAEGRLVLADALAWMAEQGPDAMVNIATLTGAMAVALGTRVAGVLSNRPELSAELLAASERTGEPLWEMPLVDDYRKLMKSNVADIKNISGIRQGGAITAGLFLKDFVGDTPWAHLDIAGPAWVDKPEHYLPAGASGYGTRLLLDWITSRAG